MPAMRRFNRVISNDEMKNKFGASSLLTTSNAKTIKGEKYGYRTYIMHLAPSNLSGNNTCPSASMGCASACLNTAGMGCYGTVQNARVGRTKFFFEERDLFMEKLEDEIRRAIESSKRADLIPAFRLNGTSDIKWENIRYGKDNKTIFEKFPEVQFYDYTKIPNRKKNPAPNYQLVFSRSEDNERFVNQAMDKGQNVAVVFGTPPGLPERWSPKGRKEKWKVLDGDESDLRFLDPPKSIVGLTAKGRGKRDTTGFVLYGTGVIDIDNLADYRKRAAKDPSIIGQRKIDGKSFVPIQSKLSRAAAERTADLLRSTGRNARIIEHRPEIAGKTRTAYAVYTPGAYARTKSGALKRITINAPTRNHF